MPTSGNIFDKENSTVQGIEFGESTRKAGGKKLRSKSIGPGGLEALGESTGNIQKVELLLSKLTLSKHY